MLPVHLLRVKRFLYAAAFNEVTESREYGELCLLFLH